MSFQLTDHMIADSMTMLNTYGLACRITVNFSMQLTHIIRETRYLDRMTFTIPEFALNVTLQEDRYLQCVDGLTDMLEKYYKVKQCSFLLTA